MSLSKKLATFALVGLAVFTPAISQSPVDLASVPLGSSTGATPNLIFGIDDSGSMDYELLLKDTYNGALWYDNTGKFYGTGTGSSFVFNADATDTGYMYLFPNGSGGGTSDMRRQGDGSGINGDNLAVPPTPAFAFARSNSYNQLYYDPSTRYLPWSQAYISAAVRTFTSAPVTAARSHPWYPTTGTPTTFDLTSNLSSTATNWTFRFLPGMVIPGAAISGIQVFRGSGSSNPCGVSGTGSSFKSINCDFTVPTSEYYEANVPYFPATYWKLLPTPIGTACDSPAVCADAPDHTASAPKRLLRVEIRPATTSYPKGTARTDCAAATCTYAEEMQNFANWFQYGRRRRLMMAAGMGQALDDVRGIRGGYQFFNNRPIADVTMYDFSAASAASNGQVLMGAMYASDASGGTPTRSMLKYIGDQYKRTDASAPVQYGCQRNNAFIVTDGFNSTTTAAGEPSYASTYVATPPYTTIATDSLASIASSYYTNNLRADLPLGLLTIDPTYTGPNPDLNQNIHMNTFAVTMGALGMIFGRTTPSSSVTIANQYAAPFVYPPTWPAVTTGSTPAQIDDLWHATINGRGNMFNAKSADELSVAINNVVRKLQIAAGSDAGIAVQSVSPQAGNNAAYVSSYNAQDWTGQMCAYSINLTDGSINTASGAQTWCARNLLDSKTPSARVIASHNGTNGVKFATGTGGLSTALVNGLALSGSDGDKVLDYLRGDRSREGSDYRTRTHLLGDITTAEPLVFGDYIYQAANDGMLHAFRASDGVEQWAYMPYNVLGTIKELARDTYTHRYYVDGTPVAQNIGTTAFPVNILVGGLRGGGSGYYALNITTPAVTDEAVLATNVLWEIPNASFTVAQRSQFGVSYGKPSIVKLPSGTWVALVTSGYNNTSNANHLHVVNVLTGAILRTITTPSGQGLAQISARVVDPVNDPTVDFVYGGDLNGNLWRFDLTNPSPAAWTVTKLASFAVSGVEQPITSQPEISDVDGRRMITVMTGKLLGMSDRTTTALQSVYSLVDNMTTTPLVAQSSLRRQTLSIAGDGTRNITSNAINWVTQKGWFFDLPAGERVDSEPTLAFGVLTFVSNLPSALSCGSKSYIYAVSITNGGQPPAAAFATGVTPWSGKQVGFTYASRPVVIKLPSGKVVAITHKSDSSLNNVILATSNAGGGMKRYAWREVFR